MSKLGKKARKFAKKNLQSVQKKKRQTNATFNKRRNRKGGKADTKEEVENLIVISNGRSDKFEAFDITSIDTVFTEKYKDELADASDSDGYLSEHRESPCVLEAECGNALQDEVSSSTCSAQNKETQANLATLKKKLDRMKKKDPDFCSFLDSYKNRAKTLRDEDAYSDDDHTSDQGEQGEDDSSSGKRTLLTSGVVSTWGQMVKELKSWPALASLLNAYRTVCHYGADSVSHRIKNSEAFCKTLLFVLSNADYMFRDQVEIPTLNFAEQTVLFQKLKELPPWGGLKPFVKSYVRSTLFLLNQGTDTDILELSLSRLRASLVFVTAFPSLLQRLIKVAVHLWATGGGALSFTAFQIIRDITSVYSSIYLGTCLSKMFIALTSLSRATEIADVKHIQFMRDCIVELCSQDMQMTSRKAVASISQLSKILKLAAEMKAKESVKKVCSWEYVNCIDLWVRFISSNIQSHDLQHLFYITIQLINGLAHMFPGPRYFPLRLKCVEWLNILSSSSGNFIPLSSLVLDLLEYKVVKEGRKSQDTVNFASVLKLPKHYIKLKNFQDECIQSALEQLASHFSQWSCHISFPDLAAIPLIRLRKFIEIAPTESMRRLVKRMFDQVEQNIEFVQKKRDEVSFSPHEHQSAESFLQLEKSSLSTSFSQYYKSVLDKASERSLRRCGQMSLQGKKPSKGNKGLVKRKAVTVTDADGPVAENGHVHTKRHKTG